MASALLVGQGPARCGFFRAAAVPQELSLGVMGTPLVKGADWPIVEVEEDEDVDEVELIDEEELAR